MGKYGWVRGAVFLGLIVAGAASVALVSRDRAATAATAGSPWQARIDAVERALARGDLSRAIYVWRDAYADAWRSRQWEALLAVGDTAMHMDLASRSGETFKPEARRAYLEALFRAREIRSHEGIRRVAAAFADLGDAEMAERVSALAPQSLIKQAER